MNIQYTLQICVYWMRDHGTAISKEGRLFAVDITAPPPLYQAFLYLQYTESNIEERTRDREGRGRHYGCVRGRGSDFFLQRQKKTWSSYCFSYSIEEPLALLSG